MSKLKNILANLLFRLAKKISSNFDLMAKNFQTLAIDFGQYESIKEGQAIDSEGSPLPWYTYPAIEYLNSFDFTDCDVFEFGSGNSSLYWANRAKSVLSVEDDEGWFNIVNKRKRENQTIVHRDTQESYSGLLQELGRLFDVIIIDGKWRKECVAAAMLYLKNGGIILLDNSDRLIEKECGLILRERGFIQIDFSGFGPINNYCWSTSIFVKVQDRFQLQRNFSGPVPTGGLGI